MNFDYMYPRELIALTMANIYRHRLTSTSGGNISVLDETGKMWITPAGLDKGSLMPRDIVCVLPDGTVQGLHEPSSEYPFHRAIYDARPDLSAVIHAHPCSLVAFSTAKRPPNVRVMPQTYRWNRNVAFAPYARPGSEALGQVVSDRFAAGYNSVILEGHGVCCAGRSLGEAFGRFDTLEFSARAEIKSCQIGIPRSLSDEDLLLEKSRDAGFFGILAPTKKARPLALTQAAESACSILQRGIAHHLFRVLLGTVSMRVGPDSFLITAHACNRLHITPQDFVLIKEGRVEVNHKPSRMALLHQAIYREHPEVNAIINASPVNAMAFCMCHRVIDTRAIPENYSHLREIAYVPFARVYQNPEEVAKKVSLSRPALEIGNHSVLTVGCDLAEAYNRLDLLEHTAESLLLSMPLGGYVTMPPSVLNEL